jgi:hypothetical protein
MKLKHVGFLLRWGTIVATVIFVGKAFADNWYEVSSLQIERESWFYLLLALGVSLLSHCWSGILWGEILKNLNYPVPWRWAMKTFLFTEIAKYLPGDIWQVYGRLRSARKVVGVPTEVGIASIILQSIYIAAAGLGCGLLIEDAFLRGICWLGLAIIAVSVHPALFSSVVRTIERFLPYQILHRLNLKQLQKPQLRYYPLPSIAGQFLFLGLRSASFLLTLLAFTTIPVSEIVPIFGGFSFAWALGIVAPISGGVGVFEATAISVLDRPIGSSDAIGAVILYRLIALMTEIIGSGLGWLMKRSQESVVGSNGDSHGAQESRVGMNDIASLEGTGGEKK